MADPQPPPMPPVTYLSVYRLEVPRPKSVVQVWKDADVDVFLHPGPLGFAITRQARVSEPPAVAFSPQLVPVQLGPACYLIIRQVVSMEGPGLDRKAVALRGAAMAGIFELHRPGLLFEKIYEGPISRPGQFIWWPEHPFTITSYPATTAQVVAEAVGPELQALGAMSEKDRGRFQLACRWFCRGVETRNPTDKLLFLWTVLEIHPCAGTSDVPGATSRYLASQLGGDARDYKAGLWLGRMTGLRGKIVHDGLAFVDETDEPDFRGYLDRVQATAAACLRLLARLPVEDRLTAFVDINPGPTRSA